MVVRVIENKNIMDIKKSKELAELVEELKELELIINRLRNSSFADISIEIHDGLMSFGLLYTNNSEEIVLLILRSLHKQVSKLEERINKEF